MFRKRCHEIGIKLIFAALLCDIRSCAAEHFEKCSRVCGHFRHALLHPFLQHPGAEPTVADEWIKELHHQIAQELCRNRGRLVKIRTAENSEIHVNVPPRRQKSHK